jgi:hypothetical protein
VPGNKLRLLDNRRTPGIIKHILHNSAMFQWEITDFEDKGRCWEIPIEDVNNYQFAKDSDLLDGNEVEIIKNKVKDLDQKLIIKAKVQDFKKTQLKIEGLKVSICNWLNTNSVFFRKRNTLDFNSNTGSKYLALDLVNYMKTQHLDLIEKRTADIIVMNPFSGEWMKGMNIVFAEMGVADYRYKIPRTKDIFNGIGSKNLRKKYILHRLAFISAYYELLGISEIVLFRGMSSTKEWKPVRPRSLVSFSFNEKVAKSFANIGKPDASKHSYFLKRTMNVNKVFMSYLETGAMNRQYKEAEALVFYDSTDTVLW